MTLLTGQALVDAAKEAGYELDCDSTWSKNYISAAVLPNSVDTECYGFVVPGSRVLKNDNWLTCRGIEPVPFGCAGIIITSAHAIHLRLRATMQVKWTCGHKKLTGDYCGVCAAFGRRTTK